MPTVKYEGNEYVVPEWANYIARDADYNVYAYADKPGRSPQRYRGDGRHTRVFPAGLKDWKESLICIVPSTMKKISTQLADFIKNCGMAPNTVFLGASAIERLKDELDFSSDPIEILGLKVVAAGHKDYTVVGYVTHDGSEVCQS